MSDSTTRYRPPALVLALSEAVKAVNRGTALAEVLQTIAQTSRRLLDAEHAAVAVLRPDGSIGSFEVAGLSPSQIDAIGALPQGHGLLGAVITSGETIRIPDIGRDPRAVGFPPHHPPMRSFLGVPIRVGDHVVGDLYVTDKRWAPEFDQTDTWIAEILAEHAGIAVAKAREAEARDALISVAAHEMRTPVAGAQLAIDTAIAGADELTLTPRARELMREVSGYIADLHEELEAWLDFARMERGALRLELRRTSLRDICQVAQDRMAAHYGAQRIRSTPASDPIVGMWDPLRMTRVVANVLENALRYSPDDSAVNIALAQQAGHAHLAVTDRGPGIASGELAHIWRPYTRGSGAGRDGRGAGIGLYVVRSIVEAHGGSVRLASREGEGTTVTVDLPIRTHDDRIT